MPGFKIKEQEGYYLSTAERETLEAITVLGDPGADRILFWDESANTWKFLTVGTGLNITDTTLTSTGLSNPMTAIGDMIYGDTAGAVARLAGNTTTTKKFLTSVGDGTNSTAPAYSLDFSTDGTFAGNSDTIIPSQKAIKTYVDGSVAGLDGKLNLDQTSQQTILNDSPLFSEGVEMSNDKWLKSKDYAGTGYLNILKGNEDNEVDVGTQLNVGSIEAEEDSGAISLFDMAVSSASADGTEMSATIKIDGNNILKIYAESDGAGGVDTFKVQLLNKAVLTMQDSAGTTHTYTADTDGSLIIS